MKLFLSAFLVTLVFLRLSYTTYGGDCVPNEPPVANFVYSPTDPLVGDPIFFDASTSYDPDGFIASYAWDFGDGNTTEVSDAFLSHHYDVSGTYNVTLTVTDSGGLKGSTSLEITVTATSLPPSAVFTYSPTQPQVGEPVTFNASQSKPNGGYITSYMWDFGDGNVTIEAGPVIIHVYYAFGAYAVTLKITDSENGSAVASDKIMVWAYPHADFTFEPPDPRVNETVKFDASISTPNGGYITSYEWHLGDSTREFGIIVTHLYEKTGNYTVTLNVTDSEGKWDVRQKIVEVRSQREDLNEDGKVNIIDLALVCKAYGSYPGHPRWDPKVDIIPDKVINILDAIRIAGAFHP